MAGHARDGGSVSALFDNLPLYRRMTVADLDTVVAIENEVYPHPWTTAIIAGSWNAMARSSATA
jgi:hypothetical protein